MKFFVIANAVHVALRVRSEYFPKYCSSGIARRSIRCVRVCDVVSRRTRFVSELVKLRTQSTSLEQGVMRRLDAAGGECGGGGGGGTAAAPDAAPDSEEWTPVAP